MVQKKQNELVQVWSICIALDVGLVVLVVRVVFFFFRESINEQERLNLGFWIWLGLGLGRSIYWEISRNKKVGKK